jgi:hypothetical protein
MVPNQPYSVTIARSCRQSLTPVSSHAAFNPYNHLPQRRFELTDYAAQHSNQCFHILKVLESAAHWKQNGKSRLDPDCLPISVLMMTMIKVPDITIQFRFCSLLSVSWMKYLSSRSFTSLLANLRHPGFHRASLSEMDKASFSSLPITMSMTEARPPSRHDFARWSKMTFLVFENHARHSWLQMSAARALTDPNFLGPWRDRRTQ